MRIKNPAQPLDGERKSRRGREKWAKRWGKVGRDDIDAIVAELEGESNETDGAKASFSWLDAISRVSFAILRGAFLGTESHAVGVLETGESLARFACIRVSDARVIEVFHAVDEGGIDERGPYAVTHRERDWSAFGAARAFVDSVGAERAMSALEERTSVQKTPHRARLQSVVEFVEA